MKERKTRAGKHRAGSTWSKQLRWLLWHGPAMSLMGEREGSWRAGLCWIVAEGLLRWVTLSRVLPPDAVSLVVLGDAQCPAHHVVVCVRVNKETTQEQDWYLDANGVSTQGALLRYWLEVEGLEEPFLAPYDERLLLDLGIPRDGRMSTRLAECFAEAFGNFSLAFLEEGEEDGP